VLELAVEHVRHRLEASVRMVGRSDRLARRVIGGAHLVEQKEGIDSDDATRWKGAAHHEAPAFGLAARDEDACNGTNLGHVDLRKLRFDASPKLGVPATHSFHEGNGALPSARRIATLPPMKVAVTGASGQLGTVMLRRLAADRAIKSIVALDLRPPVVASSKVRFVRADIRDPAIGDHFAGCDAVFHLAFVVTTAMPRTQMDDINVGGSKNVFEQAANRGVPHVLYASSVAAYGVTEHPGTIDETTPRKNVRDFGYSSNKYEVEAFLDAFEKDHPTTRVTRIRPAILIGTNMEHALGEALRRRLLVELAPAPQPIVWDEDVADAFHLAMKKGAAGAFNVVADHPLSTSEMARAGGFRLVRVPMGVAMSAVRFAAAMGRLGLGKPIDPAWVAAAGVRLQFSSEKAKRELGWSPRCRTSLDVIRRFADVAPHAADMRIALFLRLADRGARGVEPPEDAKRMTARVHLCLQGAGGSDWTLAIDAGHLSIHPGIPRPPDAVLTLKASHFLDLMSGKADFGTAQLTGKVRVEGEPRMAMILGAMVRMFRQETTKRGPRGVATRTMSAWFAH
jgi:nucleoside-diphosphate-sugar epimerase/putative sterol carrier protein